MKAQERPSPLGRFGVDRILFKRFVRTRKPGPEREGAQIADAEHLEEMERTLLRRSTGLDAHLLNKVLEKHAEKFQTVASEFEDSTKVLKESLEQVRKKFETLPDEKLLLSESEVVVNVEAAIRQRGIFHQLGKDVSKLVNHAIMNGALKPQDVAAQALVNLISKYSDGKIDYYGKAKLLALAKSEVKHLCTASRRKAENVLVDRVGEEITQYSSPNSFFGGIGESTIASSRPEVCEALLFVNQRLETLSDFEKVLIRERFDDRPMAEIAESLGRSSSSLYRAVHRALRKLGQGSSWH